MSDQNLTLLQQAQRHAATQALDAVEETKSASLRVEVTTDGAVEGSVSDTVSGGPKWLRGAVVTGYAKYAWAGVKGFVGGLRLKKDL